MSLQKVLLAAQQLPGAKVSKSSVHYRPSDGEKHCGGCYMFSAGSCTLVEGSISPDSVCDRYVPIPHEGAAVKGPVRLAAVLPYTREEHGRLQRVGGYTHLARAIEATARNVAPGPGGPRGSDAWMQATRAPKVQMHLLAAASALRTGRLPMAPSHLVSAHTESAAVRVGTRDIAPTLPGANGQDLPEQIMGHLSDTYDLLGHDPGQGYALSGEPVELSEVHGYERREHGKLESVGEYQTSKVKSFLGGLLKPFYGKQAPEGFELPPETAHGGLPPKYGKYVKPPATQGNFIDALGHKHWGWYGAAGLMVRHTDAEGVTRYLLQRRAGGVQHSGTWSVPGGAIDKPGGVLEAPEAAAVREAEEEFGKMPDLHVIGSDVAHHGDPSEPGHWSYTTVHASTEKMFKPHGAASHGFESGGSRWVTPAEMSDLHLHPDFVATAVGLGMPAPEAGKGLFRQGDKVTTRVFGATSKDVKIVPGVVEKEGGLNLPHEIRLETGDLVHRGDTDLRFQNAADWQARDPKGYAKANPPMPSYHQNLTPLQAQKAKGKYEPGDPVSWRYHGKTIRGAVESQVQPGPLPNTYMVKPAGVDAPIEVGHDELRYSDPAAHKPSHQGVKHGLPGKQDAQGTVALFHDTGGKPVGKKVTVKVPHAVDPSGIATGTIKNRAPDGTWVISLDNGLTFKAHGSNVRAAQSGGSAKFGPGSRVEFDAAGTAHTPLKEGTAVGTVGAHRTAHGQYRIKLDPGQPHPMNELFVSEKDLRPHEGKGHGLGLTRFSGSSAREPILQG